MTAPAPTFQALLDRVNARRAACQPPREPVTLHQLGAVLVLKAQLIDLLEQTFDVDFRLSLLALGVPLDPEYTPTYVCSVCGDANVEHAFWADPNTEEVNGEFGEWNYDGSAWCNDCGEHHDIVEVREYRAPSFEWRPLAGTDAKHKREPETDHDAVRVSMYGDASPNDATISKALARRYGDTWQRTGEWGTASGEHDVTAVFSCVEGGP